MEIVRVNNFLTAGVITSLGTVSQCGWKFAPRLATLLLRVYTYFRPGVRLLRVVTLFYSRVKNFPIAGVITPQGRHNVSQTGWKFAPGSAKLQLGVYKNLR